MNLHEIPYKVIISLPKCADRRWRLHERLCEFGIEDAVCEHPVPIEAIDAYEYPHLGEKVYPYISQILTIRKVLADAKSRNAKCLWILEDDACFHPQFFDRVRRLRVPNNWRFLYLGGAFYSDVHRINQDIVKPEKILDLHSVIIRWQMYDIVDRALDDILHDWTVTEPFADVTLASLHQNYPAYLCSPNLVWQSEHHSDLNGKHYSNYRSDGRQWHCPNKVSRAIYYTVRATDWERLGGFCNRGKLIEEFMRSASLANDYFSRTVLYTDVKGRELLQLIPVDDVVFLAESSAEYQTEGEPYFKAKLATILKQAEPFLHIDHDIFLEMFVDFRDEKLILAGNCLTVDSVDEPISWLLGLRWLPGFVKYILSAPNRLEIPSVEIIGGDDTEFFSWYGKVVLEILDKPENTLLVADQLKKDEEVVSIAILSVLLGVCAKCKTKTFKYLSSVKPPETDETTRDLNRRSGLRLTSSTESINLAKGGFGWFFDLHGFEYKVILADSEKSSVRTLNACMELGIEGVRVIHSLKSSGPQAENEKRDQLLKILAHVEKHLIPQVMIFFDGIYFHGKFRELIHRIKIPYDWQIISLGGESSGTKEYAGRGVIKSNKISDVPVLIFKLELVKDLQRLLEMPLEKNETVSGRIVEIQRKVPTYLCEPALISMEATGGR